VFLLGAQFTLTYVEQFTLTYVETRRSPHPCYVRNRVEMVGYTSRIGEQTVYRYQGRDPGEICEKRIEHDAGCDQQDAVFRDTSVYAEKNILPPWYADRFVPYRERTRAAEAGGEPEAIPFLKRFTGRIALPVILTRPARSTAPTGVPRPRYQYQ
jgi:hypothetical protein